MLLAPRAFRARRERLHHGELSETHRLGEHRRLTARAAAQQHAHSRGRLLRLLPRQTYGYEYEYRF